jgi:two-component system chemotaxis sensor kinase CheA
MLQYRGAIIPMARVSDVVTGGTGPRGDGPLSVVVYRRGERTVGLVVDEILDVVDKSVDDRTEVAHDGVDATIVVGSRITEVLDVREAILRADPSFFDDAVTAEV